MTTDARVQLDDLPGVAAASWPAAVGAAPIDGQVDTAPRAVLGPQGDGSGAVTGTVGYQLTDQANDQVSELRGDRPGASTNLAALSHIEAVIAGGGQIMLGTLAPVKDVAVAHDGSKTLAVLRRRPLETVPALLARLDAAIAYFGECDRSFRSFVSERHGGS